MISSSPIFNSSAEGKSGFVAQDLLAKFAGVSDGLAIRNEPHLTSSCDAALS